MSVHEILNAITEAKTALDREPVLQSRITELEHNLDKSQRHAQELELKLMERNATIDALQSKCRSLEVERDDVGFRELEAQDKLDALRNVVKTFTAAAESLMPKPVEVAQAEPVSEAVPIRDVPEPSPGFDHMGYRTDPVSEAGQSASPLPSSATITQASEMTDSARATATPTTDAPLPKPYEGKTYSQVFGSEYNTGCDRDTWVNGGGTYTDFYM
jgi:hypothetical protein